MDVLCDQAMWTDLAGKIAKAVARTKAKFSFVFSRRIAIRLNSFSFSINCSTFARRA